MPFEIPKGLPMAFNLPPLDRALAAIYVRCPVEQTRSASALCKRELPLVEGVGEIGKEVFHVFDAHGVSDQIVLNPNRKTLFSGELVEAHQGGLFNQTLDAP